MKFLSDVNVLLDVMLDRQPWSLDASQLFDEAARQGIVVVVSAIALPIVFYIARREAGRTTAYAAIDRLLAMTEIVAVDYQRLATARAMAGPDFEDNVQIACAVNAGVDRIVTRDRSDFVQSPIPIASPKELLSEWSSQP